MIATNFRKTGTRGLSNLKEVLAGGFRLLGGKRSRRFRLLAAAALVAAAVVAAVTLAWANTNAQTLPFSQNWDNTDLVTTNDDWSGVPGIMGYRGDGLISGEGVNPGTITADGSGTPVDVEANKTNPGAHNSGGVMEFHQTNQASPEDNNPTVALQGSGTRNAPHLVLNLNTTGQSNVGISYTLRDIDNRSNSAVMPVALQYRVGSSGPYTNVPAGYVADATTGPNLADLNTSVSAVLPAAANNRSLVQVRIITSDAAGQDEWVGVDDIRAVNATPSIDLNGGASGNGYSATFTEDAGSVAIVDGTASVSDADSTNLSGATVTISNLLDGAAEALSATTTGTPITASYNSSTGTLTLSGTATVAQYQQVLRTVRYNNTSQDPTTTARSITFKVNDGTYNSNTATSTVTVNSVNDAPTISATGNNPTFTENGSAVDLFGSVTASTVESGQSVDQLTLTVGNARAGDVLRIDGTDVALTNGNTATTATNDMNVSVSVSGGTATVTIGKSGGVTAATSGSIVDGLSYRNTGDDPGSANRAVTLTGIRDTGGTANGGSNTSNPNITSTVTVTPVNDAPSIVVSGTGNYIENSAPIIVDTGAIVSDADSTDFATGTLTVDYTAGGSPDDRLAIRNEGTNPGQIGVSGSNITHGGATIGTFTGGTETTPLVITFNASATPLAVMQLARNITFENLSDNPSTTTRTVRFVLTDGDGGTSSPATKQINVTTTNDDPTISSVTPSSATVDEGSSSTITVSATDPDSSTLTYEFDCTNDGTYESGVLDTNSYDCTYADNGTYTAKARVTDDTGGSATSTTSVTATNVAPSVDAGADATVDEDTSFTRNGSFTDPGTADTHTATVDYGDGAGAQPLTLNSDKTFSLSHTYVNPGTYTVTVMITDDDNGTGSDTLTVTANDTTPPTITGTPSDTVEEATGPDGATVTYASPTATDEVDGTVDVSCSPASGSTFGLGETLVTCTATDETGNETTSTFEVTVQDTTAPTIVGTPSDITEEATGPDGAAVTYTSPTASDAVDGDGVEVDCSPASGSTFALGTKTVTCTATDKAGNTSTSTFEVTVQDTTAPTISGMPADITEEATSSSGATVTYSSPTANDAVDGEDMEVSCAPASGSTFALGETLVTCTATDAAGNVSESTFTVKVEDTTAPTITGTPSDIIEEATGPDGATVSYDPPTATDTVDGAVNVSCSPASGGTFAIGATLVTCTATDAAGNQSTSTFTVTVEDTTAPTISDTPSNLIEEATSSSGATVTYASPTATDAVDGTVSVSCSPASGSTFGLGETTVTCTATDAAGNVSESTFTVTVQDTTAPVIMAKPNITEEATGPEGARVTYAAPTATDAVDGEGVEVGCSPASGSTFALGTTTVACMATDEVGNTSTREFEVKVQDTTAPTISGLKNITEEATSSSGATVEYAPTAADAVDGEGVEVSCSPVSGSTFALGTTTVTCTATDKAGNTSESTFKVTVQDTTAPDTLIDDGPTDGKTISNNNPSFKFSSPDSPVTFECKLTGPGQTGDYEDCTSAKTKGYSNLTDGTYTFEVRAVDAAGNKDQTPATRTFTVQRIVPDTTAPDTRIDSGPEEDSTKDNKTQRFTFSSPDDEFATFECSINGGGYQDCESGDEFAFTEGENTFEVRAIDLARNKDKTPDTRTFTVRTAALVVGDDRGSTAEAAAVSNSFISQYASSKASSPTRLYRLGTDQRPYTFNKIGADVASPTNAIGYRSTDRSLYGYRIAGKKSGIVKVDPTTGATQYLGVPRGLPNPVNYIAGDVSPDGSTYYLYGEKSGVLQKVDLKTFRASSVKLSSKINVADLAVSPTDDNLYGVAGDGKLLKIDPRTGKVTAKSLQGLDSGTYGATWFTAEGDLIAYENGASGANGTLTWIKDPTTTTPSVVSTQAGPSTKGNDGAANIAPPDPAGLSVVVDVLGNDGGSNSPLDRNSLRIVQQPAHGTVSINADKTITYTSGSSYRGTDSFRYEVCDTGSSRQCGTATVNITSAVIGS